MTAILYMKYWPASRLSAIRMLLSRKRSIFILSTNSTHPKTEQCLSRYLAAVNNSHRPQSATWLNNLMQNLNESQLKPFSCFENQHSPHAAPPLWNLQQHMEESQALWALRCWQLSNQRKGPAPTFWRNLTCSIKCTPLLTEENHNIKAIQAKSFPAPEASQFLGGA